jgi:tRNA-splicing ligase RtcB
MRFELREESPWRWRIDAHGDMRVPGVVFASADLLPDLADDRSLDQVCNVATLPGIVAASFAMPDVHWGYGFPIGGVAATDVDAGGVVSPGGVGFDISCGVRLLVSDVGHESVAGRLDALMDRLDHTIPRGLGKGAVWDLADDAQLERVLRGGARYAVDNGFGTERDLDRCEDRGTLADVRADLVSDRAHERGLRQVGSLGAGNHFLEVQVVDAVLDGDLAARFGLFTGQVCVMIHSGSRGLGHQVCSDYVKSMVPAMARYGIVVPDRQLACVPVLSPEGREYLQAMGAAANFARANRQALTAAVRDAFAAVIGGVDLPLLYDVSHNLAKIETHVIDGVARQLCVHRKGATRALPPGHADLPDDLRATGQPVLVPGSMGTASYVLAGVPGSSAFHSACHGAGRRMSRHAARRAINARNLRRALEGRGIRVRVSSLPALSEEAPDSYKDVDHVVAACEHAGLARRVVRLRPIGVIKG